MKTQLSAALLCILVIVPGCDRAAAERGAGQLAARVNGTGIALRELGSAGATGQGAKGALEKVIERELLVQQALHAGLDRDPQVLEQIENARRQVLARAWLDKVAAGRGVSRDDVRAFYEQNPALFAERRVYRLRELAVAAPAEMTEMLRAEAAKATDLEQVAAWLHARSARFRASATTLAAEQVPLARLPRLARMSAGEIEVFAERGLESVSVVQLVQAEEAALSEQEAAPVIEQFLAARARLEVAEAEVKRLRQVATIEYAGEFKRSN